jgi:predicted signal transduction protein with EAL and GGDEF domain
MKKKIIKISLVMTGVLFSVSTVYAASDAYQNFIDWANQEKNKAQQQLKTNLDVSVEKEIALLNEKTNHLISESNKEIANMSMTEMEDTKNAINRTLANHKQNLELSASEISKNSSNNFSEIAKKINIHSSSILDTFETDYHDEMSKLTYNPVDKSSVEENYQKSAENLSNEIELTQESINQLKEIQAVEENQHIKDYIQRKIELLEQLIVLLQEG